MSVCVSSTENKNAWCLILNLYVMVLCCAVFCLIRSLTLRPSFWPWQKKYIVSMHSIQNRRERDGMKRELKMDETMTKHPIVYIFCTDYTHTRTHISSSSLFFGHNFPLYGGGCTIKPDSLPSIPVPNLSQLSVSFSFIFDFWCGVAQSKVLMR